LAEKKFSAVFFGVLNPFAAIKKTSGRQSVAERKREKIDLNWAR